MIESLLEIDKQLFIFLNGLHLPWLDGIMLFFSKSLVWIPLYVLIIIYIIRQFGLKKGFEYVVLIILSVGLSDFISSGIMKPYFHRLRPCHDFMSEMNLVGKCGGIYGFPSSHAANTFALFFSMFKIFGKRHCLTILILGWAIIVSYSRIYLGVHFPIDIFSGAIVGILITNIIFDLKKLKIK